MSSCKYTQREIAIQAIAMPANTNANGDIFGGWLVSQMDLAGGVAAKQISKGRITTVAIDSMVFHEPVQVGDLVCCFAQLLKIGNTSMRFKIEVETKCQSTGTNTRVTEGIFTYVAIDDNGRPRKVTQN